MTTTRTTALLALTLLLLAPAADAKYRPMGLPEVLARAELIVQAKILSVGKTTVTVEIEQALHGKLPAPGEDGQRPRLRVQKFRDWTCASRWTAYRPGQRLVWCLTTVANSKTVYRPLGAGDEGELPVVGKHAYFGGILVDHTLRKTVQADGARFSGQPLVLKQLLPAIKGFRSLFRHHKGKLERTGDPAKVAAFAKRSPLHAELARGAR